LKKKKKPVVKEPEKTDDPELQDEVELPKKGYNLDFLDKLDDPNFNPFETDQIVAPQSETENVVVPEKITEDKIVTEEEKTTYGGYNLDNLDDPNFNPFESKSGIQNHEEVLEDSEAVSDSTMILDLEPKQNTESVIDSNNLNTTVDIPTKDSTPEFEQNEIVTENTRDLRGESPEVDRPSVEVRPESPQSNSSGYSSIPPVPEMSFALPEPVNIEELLAHDFTQTQNSTMSDLITNQSQISGELGELAKMGLMHEERLLQRDKEVSRLNAVVKQKQAEVDQLRIKLEMHSDNNSQMMVIVDEFEKTIQQLIQDKERSQVVTEIERERIFAERNQIFEDLQAVERAFTDLHRKYERTKEVIAGFKSNEDALKSSLEDLSTKYRREEERYEVLRTHAEQKLDEANSRISELQRSKAAEIAKLTALLRKSEMRIASLERSVDQKTRENQELTTICDELISKVGQS